MANVGPMSTAELAVKWAEMLNPSAAVLRASEQAKAEQAAITGAPNTIDQPAESCSFTKPPGTWLIEADISHCVNQSKGQVDGVDDYCLEVKVKIEKHHRLPHRPRIGTWHRQAGHSTRVSCSGAVPTPRWRRSPASDARFHAQGKRKPHVCFGAHPHASVDPAGLEDL